MTRARESAPGVLNAVIKILLVHSDYNKYLYSEEGDALPPPPDFGDEERLAQPAEE